MTDRDGRRPSGPIFGAARGAAGSSASERARTERFEEHLERPLGCGHTPAGAHTGAAGGAACGDVIRVSLSLREGSRRGTIEDAGFDASGCGTMLAAGSAAVALVRGASLLDAARVGAEEIAAELGGLLPSKRHAAELAADALHRALGHAARVARLAPVPGRALVAMSGGVDSAVAALLVSQEAEQTLAVTLELWADAENDGQRSCCSAQAVRCARALAHRLGLPHFSIDLREEFAAGVVAPWLTDHANGLTPYACVRCNGEVRLDGMLAIAASLGAETLATGHYARVSWAWGDGRATIGQHRATQDGATAGSGGALPLLRLAADRGKDQSYALASLAPDSLARIRFPLGGLRKQEVRQIAREAGLAVARKRDSQDLCFLAGTDEQAFLARHGGLQEAPGAILDVTGEVLGEHAGARRFTIGQRRGLRLGGGQPRFVLSTDARANTVTVGGREQLLSSRVEVRDAVLRCEGGLVDSVKIRYRGRRIPCEPPLARAGTHPRLSVELAEPVERTAPGQLACLYSGELLVGHGPIAA
ncbi:MAG: tRNA 2-thiouridine(34) synthase MnmA [Solirubrobacteraceae bacterium]